MLKRRLDCFQDLAPPGDLGKDIWKPKQSKCIEINLSTAQMIFVHPRCPGFVNDSPSLKLFLQNSVSYGQGANATKKAVTTGSHIWFV